MPMSVIPSRLASSLTGRIGLSIPTTMPLTKNSTAFGFDTLLKKPCANANRSVPLGSAAASAMNFLREAHSA